MSIEAMKQALELLEDLQGGCTDSDDGTVEALTIHCPEVIANLRAAIDQPLKINPADCHIRVGEVSEPISVGYDQTALELCKECGWKAIIPGDGCLVCARQKPKYRRGTYVRCMESDELCRVWTTSIDGGAWVKWPDGSITTYTAEQMGQAFSLEQAAPGEPVGYLKNGELFYPLEIINRGVGDAVPLYEHPRQWVELTDDEARALVNRATFGDRTNWQALVYMVDAKLKEKNHG